MEIFHNKTHAQESKEKAREIVRNIHVDDIVRIAHTNGFFRKLRIGIIDEGRIFFMNNSQLELRKKKLFGTEYSMTIPYDKIRSYNIIEKGEEKLEVGQQVQEYPESPIFGSRIYKPKFITYIDPYKVRINSKEPRPKKSIGMIANVKMCISRDTLDKNYSIGKNEYYK